MINKSRILWLFLFNMSFLSLIAGNGFPKGFSSINLSDRDMEEFEKISKKEEEAIFKKYQYAMSLANLVDEITAAISKWEFRQVKFLWKLLEGCGGIQRLGELGYTINSFFLKAAATGSFKSLKFFLAMPEVDINVKNNKGLNAFDLALYNAHNWWRHLRYQFPEINSSRRDISIINGGHLNCAYHLAKQGISIAPYLVLEDKQKLFWNCSVHECLQYINMTSFILHKVEEEKQKKSESFILSLLKNFLSN